MKWSNVKLIFVREARDQLRDRRTLFTIVVLPLLLYPLLGMSFLQVSQFMEEHPTQIRLIGADSLPREPLLLDEDGQFAESVCPEVEARLLELTIDEGPSDSSTADAEQIAQRAVQDGEFDAVVFFPPTFAQRLNRFRERLRQLRQEGGMLDPLSSEEDFVVPEPKIFYDAASDKSRIARDRVEQVLRRWRDSLVKENLRESRIPVAATEPFQVRNTDVAEENRRRAAVWSKILPFVVLIWALTGAFYPAIDLCAGEKERGTLETLLSSPAERSEIVWGKLLTVMMFSMATSLLNLASMGATGAFIFGQLEQMHGMAPMDFGPPPVLAMGWLLIALIPISALFSALALAIAAFARSSKEGQYYLVPLLLITLPLMMLPMLPAASLDLGTSLIPVSGLMMLLRALIEGQYRDALIYFPPVATTTVVCCLLAIRWAIDQFQNESVLFRESERWGLGVWLRHVLRDRAETPSFGEAVMCGILLLLIRFFANFMVPSPSTWWAMAVTLLVTQLALIATPVLLMSIMLTRSPRKTLLLQKPKRFSVAMAFVLALMLHPSLTWLAEGIRQLYPISEDMARQLQPVAEMMSQMPLVLAILLIGLTPAICEELAFRGFILSGLRHMGHKWMAIILSSLFFGLVHGLLQQSISACLVGIVIGYVAVQSGSLLPAVVFHFTHNSLAVLTSRVTPEMMEQHSFFSWLYQTMGEGYVFQWPLTVAAGLVALLVLLWFRSLPFQPYAEESLQEALDHQSARAAAQ